MSMKKNFRVFLLAAMIVAAMILLCARGEIQTFAAYTDKENTQSVAGSLA